MPFQAMRVCLEFSSGQCDASTEHHFCFSFLAALWHMEVAKPGIRSELQLQPRLKLWQHWILNPLCRAWGQTFVPALPRCRQPHCATAGAPECQFYYSKCFLYVFIPKLSRRNTNPRLWLMGDFHVLDGSHLFSFFFFDHSYGI